MPYHLQDVGDGTRIELGLNEIEIRLAAEDTDGSFSLCEYTAPHDGPSPVPHIHEATDEVLYVLDGTIRCDIDDHSVRAEPGTVVHIPSGSVHSFTATGSETARVLLWYTPGGFEGYFEEMGDFLQARPDGPADMEEVQKKAAELSDVYDQTIPEQQ